MRAHTVGARSCSRTGSPRVWLTGIFGMSTKYAEGLLAVKYRVKGKDGHTYGGPMYALERGLNMKWLAILFAVFTALASFGIGCTVQANSIALLASETFGIPDWIMGIVICVLTGAVILGGVKAIARVCTILVPFMAILYVLGCILILCMNGAYVWPAIQLIVDSAFNPAAAGGGSLRLGRPPQGIQNPIGHTRPHEHRGTHHRRTVSGRRPHRPSALQTLPRLQPLLLQKMHCGRTGSD